MALATVGVRLTADNLGGFRTQMRSANSAISEFGTNAARVEKQSRNIGRSLTGAGAGLAGALGPVAGITVGLAGAGAALKDVVSKGADFEQAMSNVGAISQATAAEQQTLSKAALDLGASTAFSATQVADGQKFLAQAGFEVNETLDAMPGLLGLAAAAQEDLGGTADTVSNILGQFQIEAKDTARVSDTLAATFTGANTDLTQLGTALSFGGASFAAMGGSIEEASVAVGIFSDAGVQASRAGTGLRSISASLAAPTKEAADKLKELGIQAFDGEGKFIGLADTVDQLSSAFEKLNPQQRLDSLDAIFGKVATPAATALINAGGDEIRKRLADISAAQENGLSGQISEQQLDNLRGDLTLLSSAYEGLSITLSANLNPSLRTITQGLTAVTRSSDLMFQGLAEGNGFLQSFAEGFSTTAPGLASFASGLKTVLEPLSGLDILPEIDFSQVFSGIDLSGFSAEAFGLTPDAIASTVGDIVDTINGAFSFLPDKIVIPKIPFDLSFVDLYSGGKEAQVNIADFIDFQINKDGLEAIQVGDILSWGKGDAGILNIADYIKLEIGGDSLANIQKITVGDILDFTAGEGGKLNIAEFITADFDAAGIEKFNVGSAFKYDKDSGFEFALPELPDLSTITESLTSVDLSFSGLSTTISGFDTALAGLGGDGGGLSRITGLITDTIGSISDSLSNVDISSAGQNFSNVITSTLDLFTTLNGLGTETTAAITAGLSDLGIGIANFSTSLVESIDGEAIGAAATTLTKSIIDRFTTAASNVDLPGLTEAATGFFASFATKLGEVATGDNFEAIGTSVGAFATTIIGQIGSALAAPDVGENVGVAIGSLADTILQSITGSFAGISEALAETDTDALVAAAGSIASNIGTALTTAFSEIDFAAITADFETYGANVATFITNLGESIGNTETFTNLTTQLSTEWDATISNLASTFSFAGLTQTLSDAFESLKTAIRNSIDSLLVGVADVVPDFAQPDFITQAAQRQDNLQIQADIKANIEGQISAGTIEALQQLGTVDLDFNIGKIEPLPVFSAEYNAILASQQNPNPTEAGYSLFITNQEQPSPTTAGYSLFVTDQEQASPSQASVNYTLGSQAAPKDRTARVNYISDVRFESLGGSVTQANAGGNPNFSGGLTQIAELMPELAILPNGQAFLFSGRQTANLPPHTQILPGDITNQILTGQQVQSKYIPNMIETQNAIQQSIINSTTTNNNAGSNSTTNQYNLSVTAQQSSGNIEDDFAHMVARAGGY